MEETRSRKLVKRLCGLHDLTREASRTELFFYKIFTSVSTPDNSINKRKERIEANKLHAKRICINMKTLRRVFAKTNVKQMGANDYAKIAAAHKLYMELSSLSDEELKYIKKYKKFMKQFEAYIAALNNTDDNIELIAKLISEIQL